MYKKLIKDKLNIDDNNNSKAFSVVRGQWFSLHRYLAKTELNIMMPFKKSLYYKIFWRKGIIWPSDFQLVSRSLIYLKFWITKYTNCARSSKSMLHFIRKRYKPFVPNAPFLYPMKTSENRDVFRGRKRVHWKRMFNPLNAKGVYIRPSMVNSVTKNVFHEQPRGYIYVLVL